jgi:hypothetical protein
MTAYAGKQHGVQGRSRELCWGAIGLEVPGRWKSDDIEVRGQGIGNVKLGDQPMVGRDARRGAVYGAALPLPRWSS